MLKQTVRVNLSVN